MDDILARANDEGQLAFSIIEASAERVLARTPVTAGITPLHRRVAQMAIGDRVSPVACSRQDLFTILVSTG